MTVLEMSRPSSASSSKPACRRLKIVHIISSLKGGGMEHFVVRLAQAQRRAGHDAVVLALQGGVLERTCLDTGLPLTILGGNNKVGRVVRAGMFFAGLRPDVAHAHNPTSLHYAVLGKQVCGSRVVMTDHAQTRGVSRAATRREAANLDATAAVSAATLREPSVSGGSGLRVVIHNGIQLPGRARDRDELREELGLADQPTAIMVAGMDPVKGHTFFLDAISQIRSHGVDLVALIVGDGAERARIQKNADNLGLPDTAVRFLGYRSDVGDLLNASDLLVLPSLNEGLPICLLEAMAHGLPVVATSVGGTPELVVDGETGILVPPADSTELARAIEAVITDRRMMDKFGAAGLERVNSLFTFAGSVEKYDDLYAGIGL
jgi:glycosyltransferase involved in cell wall biosynthesis